MMYTEKDVIVFQNDDRLEDGALYYCGINADDVLIRANGSEGTPVKLISHNKVGGFEVEKASYAFLFVPTLIRCKQEEPERKYIPFDFSLASDRAFLRDKWIRSKDKTDGLDEMKIIMIQRPFVITHGASIGCDALLKYYVFLDGSPCGKEVEECSAVLEGKNAKRTDTLQ